MVAAKKGGVEEGGWESKGEGKEEDERQGEGCESRGQRPSAPMSGHAARRVREKKERRGEGAGEEEMRRRELGRRPRGLVEGVRGSKRVRALAVLRECGKGRQERGGRGSQFDPGHAQRPENTKKSW